MSYENSNNEFPFPQYSFPSPLGHIFNDQSNLGQENNFRENSGAFTTNALGNGAPPLENPFNISQPVDDYSLHCIYSLGSQYCANLKMEQNQIINIDDGKPSFNCMKSTSSVLTEHGNSNPNELLGGCNVGGTVQSPLGAQEKSSSTYPKRSRNLDNEETFLRGAPRPKNKETTAGESQGTDLWTRIRETSKRNMMSSSQDFIPKNYTDELKEVSKDEYWKSLQSKKGKAISNLGVSTLSTTNSNSKYKSILWNAQGCGDTQASNTPSIESNGNGEGSFVILDNEQDLSTIWEDRNPLPPQFEDPDCYIRSNSQKKCCTNQVIDAGSGQERGDISIDGFVEGLEFLEQELLRDDN